MIRLMRLQPSDIVAAAERIARRQGMRKISRQQLFKIRYGKAKATETTIFLIVAAVQELTSLALGAAHLFRVQPSRVLPVHRTRGRIGGAVFSGSGHGAWFLPMHDDEASLEVPSVRLERLYHDHAPLLRAIAHVRYRIPPEDSDELVQQVFVAWFERQPRVDDIRAYLVAATNQACKYYWRKRVPETPLLDEDERDDVPAKDAERWALHLSLAATLAELGTRCRATLRRHYLDNDAAETIASDLGTSADHVRQLLLTCRKRAHTICLRLTETR
ncbi:MAG TPA: sigma-70 family RNA polymerase sigma factor [Gemmatimonadaceae bacterium]|jgi:RNA polymerase sigma factor (sigma-70 family)|nr:sigma-70 family RNA polymerase sigma factor [Gemmatimonadaceae bacterium]